MNILNGYYFNSETHCGTATRNWETEALWFSSIGLQCSAEIIVCGDLIFGSLPGSGLLRPSPLFGHEGEGTGSGFDRFFASLPSGAGTRSLGLRRQTSLRRRGLNEPNRAPPLSALWRAQAAVAISVSSDEHQIHSPHSTSRCTCLRSRFHLHAALHADGISSAGCAARKDCPAGISMPTNSSAHQRTTSDPRFGACTESNTDHGQIQLGLPVEQLLRHQGRKARGPEAVRIGDIELSAKYRAQPFKDKIGVAAPLNGFSRSMCGGHRTGGIDIQPGSSCTKNFFDDTLISRQRRREARVGQEAGGGI